MKHLAALLLTIAAFVGASVNVHAQMGGVPPGGEPAETTLLHRPTPTPGPAATTSKEKKPITASLSKDEKGKESTETFSVGDPKIYLIWKDDTASKGDKVRVAWYAEETGGVFKKGSKLTEFTQTLPGPGSFGSSILPAPKGGFPAGTYRAEVYDGKTLAKSLKFTVKK